MSNTDKAGLADKEQAEKLIEAVPRIPEVEGFNVRLDEDWTGDPSLYIGFRIRKGTVIDEPFLRRFHAYTSTVSRTIRHSGMARFPYTKLEKVA